MNRTVLASVGLTTSRRSLISYPSGGTPPIHMPLRLEAAILSRMRSPVTSRSNWAKESKTFSVSRPIKVVVLNCWVTATNEIPRASNSSTILAKSLRLLKIDASPRGSKSNSMALTDAFVAAYRYSTPAVGVDGMNVWDESLPEFDNAAIDAKYKGV